MTWDFTPDIERSIISQLENGVSMITICKAEGMPDRNTVLRWQRNDLDFAAKCAQAREAYGEFAADSLDAINERVLDGTLDPSAANVISANLKWTASKLKSRVYGDKQHVEITGKDGAPLSMRLVEMQQRLLKDITPVIEHVQPITPDDII